MENIDLVTRIVKLIISIGLVLSVYCIICIALLSISIVLGTRWLKKRAALMNEAYTYYSKNHQIINEMKIDETLENNANATKEILDNCNKVQNIFNQIDQIDLKYKKTDKIITNVLSVFSFGYIKP